MVESEAVKESKKWKRELTKKVLEMKEAVIAAEAQRRVLVEVLSSPVRTQEQPTLEVEILTAEPPN